MERDPALRSRKRATRRAVRGAILALDPLARRQQESRLVAECVRLPGAEEASTLLLYVKAFPEEIETRPFIEWALKRGQRVVCPRVDRVEHRLRLFRIRSLATDLEPGTLGIPEPGPACPEIAPREVDWALVPGVAFDRRCYRLGRGAGHYDRLLPALRPDVPRWAIGFDCQLVSAVPVEPHDVPVDGVATASTLIRRDGSG